MNLRGTKSFANEQLHSGIHLGCHIYTKIVEGWIVATSPQQNQERMLDTHSSLFDPEKMKAYQLSYLLKYAGKNFIWTETHADNVLHKS